MSSPIDKPAEQLVWEARALASIKEELNQMERTGRLTKKMALDMCAQAIMEYQKIKLILSAKEAEDVAVQSSEKQTTTAE